MESGLKGKKPSKPLKEKIKFTSSFPLKLNCVEREFKGSITITTQ